MTPDQLKEVEQWAAMPFTLDELAVILRLTPAALRIAMDDPDNHLGQSVKRGRLIAKGDLFKKVALLSQQGSGPAQAMLRSLFDRTDL